jgi:isoleucyl-tRNA synthetase
VAPFAPFIAEELWQNLKRRIDPQAPRSVHLSRWPEADRALLAQTEQLRADMEVALKAVSLGRAARQDQNLKTRQPLQAALLQVPSAAARRAIERFRSEVCEELNVEEAVVRRGRCGAGPLHAATEPAEAWQEARQAGQADSGRAGALSVEKVKQIAQSVLSEQSVMLATTEGPIELLADEILLSAQSAEGLAARTEDGLVVGITTEITPELRDRGIARELVRAIGELRKKAGCKVSDRVMIGYTTSDETAAAAIASLGSRSSARRCRSSSRPACRRRMRSRCASWTTRRSS